MEAEKGIVCVTGGTGFIASWMIKRLLEEGYSVHTTIRADPENKKDVSFLTSLPGADQRLKIFTADLNDPDSFDAAIEECNGVLHVATSFDFEAKESEEALTKRSVDGAVGILRACLKSKTVKRVVYTSSAAAVVYNGKDVEMMDDSFWSDTDFARKNVGPMLRSYTISKTLTERAALEFGTEHGLDVVTVIPPGVVGPFICPRFPGSVRFVLAMLLGNQDRYPFLYNPQEMVHVDDFYRANMFLLENPVAKGRYICSSTSITLREMAQLLSAKYPEFSIPTLDCLEVKGIKLPGVSSKKLLDTGFKFKYGVEEILDGAIKCCKEKGYL